MVWLSKVSKIYFNSCQKLNIQRIYKQTLQFQVSSLKYESKSKFHLLDPLMSQLPPPKANRRLPEKEELVNFPEIQICPNCVKPYISDGSKEAEFFEVEVKAYKRRVIRLLYEEMLFVQGCFQYNYSAHASQGYPEKSIWDFDLGSSSLNKFHYCQATNSLLNQYAALCSPIFPESLRVA